MLSDAQATICKDTSRFRLAVTGRRFGKTHIALRELCKHATQPNSNCYYIAPSYRQAKTIAWEMLTNRLKKMNWVAKKNEAELTLRLKNGSLISLKGADSPDSLRGVGLTFVALDEAQDLSKELWTHVIRPALSDRKGKAMFTLTPKGVGSWSHQLYTDAQELDDWSAFQYKTIDGGIVDEEELAQARRDMDYKTYQQEYLATFNTFSGRVFYNFERDTHVKSIASTGGVLHVGMDFNVGSMCLAIANIGEDGIVNFIDDINMASSNTDEVCTELKNRYPGAKIMVYPDPSCKARKTSAGGRTDLSILQNAGFVVKLRNAHTPVRDRINAVNAKLKNANGQVGMYVDYKGKNIIKSLERLIYKEGTNIVDKDHGFDHMSDAVGYLIDFLFPITVNYNAEQPTRWRFKGGRSIN